MPRLKMEDAFNLATDHLPRYAQRACQMTGTRQAAGAGTVAPISDNQEVWRKNRRIGQTIASMTLRGASLSDKPVGGNSPARGW